MRWDVHNHVIPASLVSDLDETDPVYVEAGYVHAAGVPFELTPQFTDADAKLAQLDELEIGGAVVSLAPPLFGYSNPPLGAETWASKVNNSLASFCAQKPERLRWVAQVPLQQPAAIEESLKEAVHNGAVGVQIATTIGGRPLDEGDLDVLWTTAEGLGIPVIIHPTQSLPLPALESWYLKNLIGNPLETAIAVERMLCAGVFVRHPELRLLLVHGGGYLPWQLGRLTHGSKVRPEFEGHSIDAGSILRNVTVDCLTHDPDVLRLLVERVGLDRVVLGTDLPFDMASTNPVEALIEAVGISAAEQIMCKGPARLFGL